MSIRTSFSQFISTLATTIRCQSGSVLIGRSVGGSGMAEEIEIGDGLTFANGVLKSSVGGSVEAVPGTLVQRGSDGSGSFGPLNVFGTTTLSCGSAEDTTGVSITGAGANARGVHIVGNYEGGYAVLTENNASGGCSIGIFSSGEDGIGLQVSRSGSGGSSANFSATGDSNGLNSIAVNTVAGTFVSVNDLGAYISSSTGPRHVQFGSTANNGSFVTRDTGAFGWTRGEFTSQLSASSTLTANQTYTLPDASGTLALTSSNVATATALKTGSTIALTGDVAYTSPSFNGTGNVTAAATLATVNSNVGTFGGTTAVPVLTIDAKGRITSATTATITSGVTSSQIAAALGYTPASTASPTLTGHVQLSGQSSQTLTDNSAMTRGLSDARFLKSDATASTLRSARVNGYNSLANIPKPLWRPFMKILREACIDNSSSNRVRVVTLGDSKACDITSNLQNHFGYGGREFSTIDGWDAEGAGVTIAYDQFARCPGGTIRTLNAAVTGGTYITYSGGANSNISIAHSIYVYYLASSTSGSFKLQYQINRTGSWVDATTAWTVSTGGGSQAAGVLNTNNGGSEVFSQAYIALPTMDKYSIRLVATSGAVVLTNVIHNAGGFLLGATEGYGFHSGAVGANYACGGRNLASHFRLTPDSVWNSALGFIDPHLIVWKSANTNQLADYQNYWDAYAKRILTAAPNALLVVVGSDPQQVIPEHLNAGALSTDDWLRDWCATNAGATFVDVRQSFPEYPTYVAASQSGTTVTLTSSTLPSNLKVGTTVRGLLSGSQTSATTVASITNSTQVVLTAALNVSGTNVSGAFSVLFETSAVDDLWNDTVHIYSGAQGSQYGGGEAWVRALVWDHLMPVFQCLSAMQSDFNGRTRVMAGVPTEIRLMPLMGGGGTRDGRLSIVNAPRQAGAIVLRQSNAFYNGGSSSFSDECGFFQTASDANNKNSLGFTVNGQPIFVFGNSGYGPISGFACGVTLADTLGATRSNDGWRFLAPRAYYSQTGLVAEARVIGDSSASATDRVMGIDYDASESAKGKKLWSWTAGSTSVKPTRIYHGRSNSGNTTTFTYDEPTGSTSAHTPVNATAGTGANVRVIGVIPSYATDAAAVAVVGVGEVYYAEDSKKVKTRMS